MKTELKDVIHLLIGCDVTIEIHGTGHQGILRGLKSEYFFIQVKGDKSATPHRDISKIKPLLRRLSSMTEEEMGEYWSIIGGAPHLFDRDYFMEWLENGHTESEWESGMVFGHYEAALTTKFLLSKGFDLFFLIETGQAIDAEKL